MCDFSFNRQILDESYYDVIIYVKVNADSMGKIFFISHTKVYIFYEQLKNISLK